MKILLNILSAILIILIIPALVFGIWYIIHTSKQMHIKAEFTELAPFQSKIPIYYKGFKIGKITKVSPKDDFTTTLMHITLFRDDVSFPENIRLQIRSYKKNSTYGELIVPENPSEKRLKENSIIEGRTNMSFDTILQNQAENGSFDLIIANVAEITTNLNTTIKEFHGLLQDIRITFKNNENYISLSTRRLSEATTHLSRTSISISNTIDQKSLDRTVKNIEDTSHNVKNITQSIDCATRNLTQTMNNIESITENVDGITNSINCTMKSRFGGFRLFFGKPDQNCKCNKIRK